MYLRGSLDAEDTDHLVPQIHFKASGESGFVSDSDNALRHRRRHRRDCKITTPPKINRRWSFTLPSDVLVFPKGWLVWINNHCYLSLLSEISQITCQQGFSNAFCFQFTTWISASSKNFTSWKVLAKSDLVLKIVILLCTSDVLVKLRGPVRR